MDLYIVYMSASDHSAEVYTSFDDAFYAFRELLSSSDGSGTMDDVRKVVVRDEKPFVEETKDGDWISIIKVNPKDTAKVISEVVPHKELRYYFEVVLSGTGTSMDEAWLDAVEHFTNDPGDMQGALRVEEVDE